MSIRIFAAGLIGLALAASVPAFAQTQNNTPVAEQNTQLNLIGRAQTQLKVLGLYNGAVSGVRTIATTRAIRRFQRQQNIRGTGQLDPRTREALGV